MKRIIMLTMVILVLASSVSFGHGYVRRSHSWSTMLGDYIDRDYRWSTMLGGYIDDYGYSSSVIYVTNREFPRASVQPAQSFEEQKKDYQEKMRVRRARIKKQGQTRERTREDDGWWAVLNYFKERNIHFEMRNRLCIRGKTLCSEFLLEDRNLLIKYRNPEAIKQAKKNPRYNEIYQKYQRDWTDFSQGYTGKIYEIKSAS